MMHDYCVIGGGIVGLATAIELMRRKPGARLILLEKENAVARHQTGHNSGVIHAGIYYPPDSLKARLCREGAAATKAFCDEHGIPYDTCGKLVVATNAEEEARLDAIYERAVANGIAVDRLSGADLAAREPNVSGCAALFVRETAIVDYRQISERMREIIVELGGEVLLGARVDSIAEETDRVRVSHARGTVDCGNLVVCAGLQSDRLASLAGLKINHRIIPFRGEYFRLPDRHSGIVRHLIYPVPDPELPFLGIHVTRMVDGGVTIGPNAVLGLSREGYAKFSIDILDLAATAAFPGFWRLLARYWRASVMELRNSLSRRRYLNEVRKFCPAIEKDDMLAYPAGIRAQAVLRDGTLVHDFLFEQTPRTLHVLNAPSPAATSAIPIGRMIVDRMLNAYTAVSVSS